MQKKKNKRRTKGKKLKRDHHPFLLPPHVTHSLEWIEWPELKDHLAGSSMSHPRDEEDP